MKNKTYKFRAVLIIILTNLLISTSVFAQTPQKMSYQAVIRNSSDDLITNTQVGMKISILRGSETGTVVYTETQTPTTNANGLVSIEFGGGTGFSSIDWSTGNYYIKTETDPEGGTDYSITGASQLLSVPYALFAGATSGSGSSNWTINGNNIYNSNSGNVGIGTTAPNRKLEIGGTGDQYIRVRANSSNISGIELFRETPGAFDWRISNEGGNLRFVWSENDFTSTKEALRINLYGNVGIGTLNPLNKTKLHVASSNLYAGYFTTDSISDNSHAVHAEFTGASSDGVAVYGKSVPADYCGYGGTFEGGYMGIIAKAQGTTNYYYGVRGIASSTSGTAYGVYGVASSSTEGTAYGVYCSGNGVYTGTWTTVSDAKFKINVTNYSGALGKIMLLRPVTYDMKIKEYPFMGFSEGMQIGLIAQEVEEVFPTLVEKGVHPGAEKNDPAVEYTGMNYVGLVPVLVNAIQEQQQQIELQQNQIDLLKQEIELLKEK